MFECKKHGKAIPIIFFNGNADPYSSAWPASQSPSHSPASLPRPGAPRLLREPEAVALAEPVETTETSEEAEATLTALTWSDSCGGLRLRLFTRGGDAW